MVSEGVDAGRIHIQQSDDAAMRCMWKSSVA